MDANFAYILNGRGVALTNIGQSGQHNIDRKKIEKPIECFDKSLEYVPSLITPLHNKGYALDTIGEYEQAIKHFDKALEKEPGHLDSLVYKGYSYGNLNNYDEAIKCFEEAILHYEKNSIVKDQNYADAYRYKGYSLLFTLSSSEDHFCILENFKKATEIDPTSIYGWNSLGHALVAMGKYDEAIRYSIKHWR